MSSGKARNAAEKGMLDHNQMETVSISTSSPNSNNFRDNSPPSYDEVYDRDLDSTTGNKGGRNVDGDSSRSNKLKKMMLQPFSNSKKKKPVILAKTPLGINRFVLLALYAVYTFICGCPYWGWNGIQEVLYKSNAFLQECDPNDPNIKYLPVGIGSYINCFSREQKINNLYTVAFAAHFVSSAVLGVVLDMFGPKITAIVGLCFGSLSWCLLGFSNESTFNAFIPAAAFMGISADPCYLSLLSVSNIFPGNESFVMSLLGSVRSCSFAIPVILSAIYTNNNAYGPNDFWKFCIGYVVVGLGLSFFIALFLIPMRPFKVAENAEERDAVADRDERRNSYTGTMQPNALDAKEHAQETAGKTSDYEAHRAAEKPNDPNSEPIQRSQTSTPFSVIIRTAQFWLIVPLFCTTLLRAEFFTKSNKSQLMTTDGANLYQMFSVMNILSFLPGPIMGKLCDTIGVLPVICLLNCLGIVMYAFLIPDVLACKGIAIFFYFLYCSFCLSNLYCYIGTTFAPEHFGKLTGIASLIAGLWTLSSLGWYKLSSETFSSLYPYNYAPVDGLMIIFGIINIPIWVAMFLLKKRKDKQKTVLVAPTTVAIDIQ